MSLARDVYGKTTSLTRSGGGNTATRSYVYDANERLCKTVEPETGATLQDYDLANNIAWRAGGQTLTSLTCDRTSVTASAKITFGYDARNRLTSTTYGDASPAITRTYTADGLPLTVVSNGAIWTTTYNRLRLPTLESLVYSAATNNLTRGYNANGHQTSLTYPDSTNITSTVNAFGAAKSVGTYATSIAYHSNGAISGFTYGNGIVHSLT